MTKSQLKKETKAFIRHVKDYADLNYDLFFWIDLFCGAGGTSTGIHFADIPNMFVAGCVNHDKNAILSHAENHPNTLHFTEDIRDFEVVKSLKYLIDELRKAFPNCKINLWASLECTNFSNAKGGQPRNGDSRSLAEHMFMYLYNLNPDSFWIENVREFMSWGPLDEKGKPISKEAGKNFVKWVEDVEAYGYNSDKRICNSADFGAYQARKRLFIQFSKPEYPISWPEHTHAKNPENSVLKKWKPVKEVLYLDLEGKSIFDRKKSLSENTLKRIYAGLKKFVANGETGFTKQYNSGNDAQRVKSLDEPIGTITTQNSHAIVSTHLNTYYGNGAVCSIEKPSPTITTKDRIAKIDVQFLDMQYGNSTPASIEKPSQTVTTNPKLNLVKVKSAPFLVNANSSTSGPNNINYPSPTITSVRTHYLVNPQFTSKGNSIETPCPTVIARQDKRPLSIVQVDHGQCVINVFEDDSETMILIKEFMAIYNIIDIKMRMLIIDELKQIQGFPVDYKLIGNQAEQKKQIGNAVEVNQAKALVIHHYKLQNNYFKITPNEKFNRRKQSIQCT